MFRASFEMESPKKIQRQFFKADETIDDWEAQLRVLKEKTSLFVSTNEDYKPYFRMLEEKKNVIDFEKEKLFLEFALDLTKDYVKLYSNYEHINNCKELKVILQSVLFKKSRQ